MKDRKRESMYQSWKKAVSRTFDRAQLKKLYPNHKAYVNAVAKNLSLLVSQHFVTKADAKKLLEEAKKAAIF